ncbi:hypothetical protein I9W82_001113 [Candida metapsilosis]|uniref:Uncharacterized protein n=1 Tax=Candida metapsilosis TaxID=273372 RepID=A0A8H7ZHR4_9ASCO|nr:hypothetical protein I9W82_001113 [Candida metapsilosis]
MSIPEQPKNKGFFPQQHGYADIDVKTHTYSDQPTPLSAHQNKASGFIAEHTDKEHAKKYAKQGGKSIFNALIGIICR